MKKLNGRRMVSKLLSQISSRKRTLSSIAACIARFFFSAIFNLGKNWNENDQIEIKTKRALISSVVDQLKNRDKGAFSANFGTK